MDFRTLSFSDGEEDLSGSKLVLTPQNFAEYEITQWDKIAHVPTTPTTSISTPTATPCLVPSLCLERGNASFNGSFNLSELSFDMHQYIGGKEEAVADLISKAIATPHADQEEEELPTSRVVTTTIAAMTTTTTMLTTTTISTISTTNVVQTTPLVGNLRRPGPKRKIGDTYPEFRKGYGTENKKPALKQRRVGFNKQGTCSVLTKKGKVTPETKPKISLKFKFIPPSNPAPNSELVRAMKIGQIAQSLTDIRADKLLDVGLLPILPKIPRFIYEQNTVRKTVKIYPVPNPVMINATKVKKGMIDLNAQYDALLQRQMASCAPGWITTDVHIDANVNVETKVDVNFEGNVVTNGNKSSEGNEYKVSVVVEENGIRYLKLKQGKFLVHRTAILIPRLSQEDINALTRIKCVSEAMEEEIQKQAEDSPWVSESESE